MQPVNKKNAAPVRTDYDYFERITLRYSDNDTNGHVNNACYYSFFDTAVEGYLYHHELRKPLSAQARTLVVASSCRYYRELSFPGDIELGVRIGRIGNSSIAYDISIFTDDGNDEAAAQGEFVVVCASHETGRPISVPDIVRRHEETV